MKTDPSAASPMQLRFRPATPGSIQQITESTNGFAGPSVQPSAEHVRVMAGNLSDTNQAYTVNDAGSRIIKGVNPDIALIQEANTGKQRGNDEALWKAWVADTFSGNTYAYRESGLGIPNAIVSRFPIKEAGEWEDPLTGDRDFAFARIVVGGREMLFVSVH
jgi:hypothetical protein